MLKKADQGNILAEIAVKGMQEKKAKEIVKVDLTKLNLWDSTMKNKLMASNGSIQNINEIPQDIKDLYKTAWEISQKVLINQAADRGAFVHRTVGHHRHDADLLRVHGRTHRLHAEPDRPQHHRSGA